MISQNFDLEVDKYANIDIYIKTLRNYVCLWVELYLEQNNIQWLWLWFNRWISRHVESSFCKGTRWVHIGLNESIQCNLSMLTWIELKETSCEWLFELRLLWIINMSLYINKILELQLGGRSCGQEVSRFLLPKILTLLPAGQITPSPLCFRRSSLVKILTLAFSLDVHLLKYQFRFIQSSNGTMSHLFRLFVLTEFSRSLYMILWYWLQGQPYGAFACAGYDAYIVPKRLKWIIKTSLANLDAIGKRDVIFFSRFISSWFSEMREDNVVFWSSNFKVIIYCVLQKCVLQGMQLPCHPNLHGFQWWTHQAKKYFNHICDILKFTIAGSSVVFQSLWAFEWICTIIRQGFWIRCR